MSAFWKMMSALSTVCGNFITRCPKCAGEMRREQKHEQAYARRKTSRTGLTSAARSGNMNHAGRHIQIVPVFDVCVDCAHTVRRKNLHVG